ncbi:MAG: hypothetical protein C3F13_09975 [Anaerolineales bacterium]|nr:hypothetical protein [Anaerolineae bacterium]PWB53152.1 MAG: hypothetical protein C3F13_09975 [Anaerolineales bacterium]
MINWSNVTILFYGVLGTLVLLLIQWLISLFLPKLPMEVIESMQHVQQTTIDGNYQGDADIYNFDRALMEAELEHPRSTLSLYYNQPAAIISRLLGSILVSFTITGWVLESFGFNCISFLVLLFGISLLFYPIMTWNSSRPTLKNQKNE